MVAEISSWHEVGYSIGLTIAAIASAYSAWHSKKAKDTGDVINDAVNHRHLKANDKGELPPKLYDAVLHLHERTDNIDEKADEILLWKRSYDGGPLDAGSKVVEFVKSVDALKDRMDRLHGECKKGTDDGRTGDN